MRLSVLLSLCFFFFTTVLPGQVFTEEWDSRYGGTLDDYCNNIVVTQDGDYLLAGYSYSENSGDKSDTNRELPGNYTRDIWIIKADSFGNKLWDKTFGGIKEDYSNVMREGLDRSYIIAGSSNSGAGYDKSDSNLDSHNIYFDYWLIKTDLYGNKIWDHTFGGIRDERLWDVKALPDGGYILAGTSNSDMSGDISESNRGGIGANTNDYWIIRIDSLGRKVWDKRYGGSAEDDLSRILLTDDGGYLLAGTSYSPQSGDKTQPNWYSSSRSDIWIVKIDSNGTKQWDKTLGSFGYDVLDDICKTSTNGFVIAGWSNGDASGDKTQPSKGIDDFWLVRIDSAGKKIWDKTFGGSTYEEPYSVCPTMGEGFLVCGYSDSPADGDKSESSGGIQLPWVLKIDSNGNKIWDKTIFTSMLTQYPRAISLGSDCFIMACSTKSGIGGDKSQENWDTLNGTNDYWMVKFCMGDTLVSVGLNERQSSADLCLAPNPANKLLRCKSSGIVSPATIRIFSIDGRRLLQKEVDQIASFQMDVSSLAPGVYFLVLSNNETFIRKQFVKRE